jgi:large subunit ribosomal protein L3
MKYIFGTKQKMTQLFDEKGVVIPVTAIQAGPIVLTQVKTLEADGYDALQFGFGTRKEKNISRAQKGHFKDLGMFSHVRETRLNGDETEAKVGDKVTVDVFTEGDVVGVQSVSKSKGFQGVVKRHGFSGGPRTHGQKHNERSPGSIGAGGIQRVLKGIRMAGRMGGDTVSIKNVKIVKVDPVENIIYVKGAVPGRPGTLIEITG